MSLQISIKPERCWPLHETTWAKQFSEAVRWFQSETKTWLSELKPLSMKPWVLHSQTYIYPQWTKNENTQVDELANSIEWCKWGGSHNELSHLHLHCLPSVSEFSICIWYTIIPIIGIKCFFETLQSAFWGHLTKERNIAFKTWPYRFFSTVLN